MHWFFYTSLLRYWTFNFRNLNSIYDWIMTFLMHLNMHLTSFKWRQFSRFFSNKLVKWYSFSWPLFFLSICSVSFYSIEQVEITSKRCWEKEGNGWRHRAVVWPKKRINRAWPQWVEDRRFSPSPSSLRHAGYSRYHPINTWMARKNNKNIKKSPRGWRGIQLNWLNYISLDNPVGHWGSSDRVRHPRSH